MAEYIERESLIKRCKMIADCEWNAKAAPVSWSDAYESFIDDIEQLPTAEVAPVVRCKDCKHWRNDDGTGYCVNPDGIDNYAMYDDFCSYGERKDNGNKV